MKKVNCLILDDEPMAARLLADYALSMPKLNLIYAGTSVKEALNYLHEENIQLIILDIQMPEINGIDLMKVLGTRYDYIISSAYSEYAIASYQFQVVDYLLKPITLDRFYQAIFKYINWKLLQPLKADKDYLQIRADRKDYRIAFDEIVLLEGMKDYIQVILPSQKLLVLETMKEIQQRLPEQLFIRIHRSFILPKNSIRSIEGNQVRHDNGNCYPIGESFKGDLLCWFNS
ncbi:LytR/AlgR family response regulator transcription factor [Sphingobacterium kyonggiense]